MDELFDTLIQKKIKYLLRILQQNQQQEENKNNNLSTLVETAIEVIKENQRKIKSFTLSKEVTKIKEIITELNEKKDPLTDEEFNDLLIGSLDALKKIEDEKILNENMKPEYNKVMEELVALSNSQKDVSKETNISKLVETAIDVITHNNNISKNKKYLDDMEENYKDIKNKFKQIIKKIIQINKDRKKDNIKALVETAVDLLSQSKTLPEQSQQHIEPITRDDKKDDNTRTLVGTAVDLLSKPKPQPQLEVEPITRDDKKDDNTRTLVGTAVDLLSKPKPEPQPELELEVEPIIKDDNKEDDTNNVVSKLNTIFGRFNNDYIVFNKLLQNNINKINEKKNSEINKLKEDYEERISKLNVIVDKLNNEIEIRNITIKRYEERLDENYKKMQNNIDIIDKKEKNIEELKIEKKNNNNAIHTLNLEIEQRNKQIDLGNNKINYLEEKITRTQSVNTLTIEEKDKNIENLQNTIKQNEDKIKLITSDLSNKSDKVNELQQQNIGLLQQIEELNENIEVNKKIIIGLRTEIENNKEQFEKEKNELQVNMISHINSMIKQAKAFEKTINEKINEIENLKEEVKNKDKQLLNVIQKITDFIPNLQDDINKLDVFFPEIEKMKNILQGIKSKTDCPGTDNLIGKIDNECLYFNNYKNTIESKSNEDNVLDALIEENKKLREQYREKIGIIKTLNSKKIREIEELKNNGKEEIEEEGEYPIISG